MKQKPPTPKVVFYEVPPQAEYQDMEATMLFCPKCNKAVPVRKNLLLILPEGEKFDYLCTICSTPIGSKIEKSPTSTLPS